MQLFKGAGGNCIATYIPWLLHEPEEGKFIFGGEDGVHDLEGFLEVANSVGLYVIARPGPYQYSELHSAGMASWLCENYPDLHAKTFENKQLGTTSLSYIHPDFLKKVRAWFDRVCPLLARHTISRGGPVAMVQLDNEMMGVHIWSGSLDYNPVSMGFGREGGRYPRFLRARYPSIIALNHAYGTAFESFEAARPIAPSAVSTPEALRRMRDYLEFYLSTVGEYAATLAQWIRAYGINVPLVHNSWNQDELFLEVAQQVGKDFLLGTDHYFNPVPTPFDAATAFCSLEMLRLMGYPPTVLELTGGSLMDWPPISAESCDAWYWAHVAFGMKGSNYYIFSGGPNASSSGATGDVYDFQAAIGPKNEIRPLYKVQKELGHFLKEQSWLVEAEREADCRFALDFELARSAQYWKNRGDAMISSPEAWEFLIKGALSSALCASLSPIFCDMRSDAWVADTTSPLIIVSSVCMAADKQRRVVDHLRRGGRVLLGPVVPIYDEQFQPTTILSDFLGHPALEENKREAAVITVSGVRNIFNNGSVYFTKRVPVGAVVLGEDESTGRVVAWRMNTEGGGNVIFLGMRWNQAMRTHEQLIRTLLNQLGLQQKVTCSNPNLWTSLRSKGSQSSLFLINLFNAPMEADLACQPSHLKKTLNLGHVIVGPMSVKYIPL
jgi:beta-galactosidase